MDRIYSEPNDENDHTERIRRQRLSSILKAPRSPLKDLGSGNEFTQDYDPEKRRKNSRRVSFADTIKVFQTDFQTNVAEPENTEQATNGRNQVLFNQNEGAEAVQCEITGMDTLLHAPIQTLGQQSEWHENNQTNKNDRTLIFLDENEMDMTASHTAVITRNLKSNEEIDKPQKIDIKSFLAGLTSKNEEPEMRKELRFFSDPTEANYACPSLQQKPDFEPIKKIDFNEFLRRLKSNRTSVSPTFEGPDKENLFFVPTQVPESSSSSPVKSVYSHAQENTSNMTRIFRGQDDGMDITNCHVSSINTMFPNTCEIVSKQLGCGEVTMACGDMGVTASQTVNMSVPKINTFNIEKQSQNIRMDLSSNFVADHSRLNRKSDHQLIVPQGSQQRVEKKTVSVEVEEDITRSHTILTDNHNVSETSDQGFRSRTVVPGCVSSEPVFHGNKTVVFSSGNDMEMTGNCTIDNCNETSRGTGRCFYEAFQKPGNSCSLLMEKTVSRNDDMDITKCQISDNHILKQCKNNSRTISFVLDNGHEKAIQSHRAASETLGPDSSANPGSWTSLDTFQHRAGTSLIVSLPSDKTIVFSGEDMDLTTSHIAKDAEVGIGSHLPPMSADMKFKPKIFGSKSSSSNLNDQEEMGISKCHALVIDNQNTEIAASQKQIQPKTISEENWDKEVNEAVSFVILDKENALSGMGDHMDIKRSNPKTMIFSSQEQEMEVPKSPTIASNTCVLKLLQRQNCEISQQLRQSLVNPSLACTNDNTVFPDDQSMDITRNHTAALNFPPILAAQEYECTHTQNSIISEPQQLQNKTLFFSGGSDIDITRSQTAAIECGSLRKNSDQKNGTPGNNQIPDRGTARFSFTSSDDVLPSGIEENVPFGKTAGIHNFGKTAGIHIDSKNSESQQQSHTMAELNKVPSNTANFEKLSSTHKASLSSKQDFTKTRISMPDTKDSQRASLSEKSDVFFSAENVDLTGSCVVNVLDTVLMKRKDNTLLPKKKDFISCRTTTAADSLQQQKGGECPLMHTKMLSRNGLISLSFSNEKTVIFSADDDGMEMTKSHTMTTDNKIYLQGESSNNVIPLIPADKTVVFTCNDDMEITRPNTIVIDKPLEKILSQTVAVQSKETGRKNPIGSSSEKTVVFSLGDENHMDMTECHTVIKEKNYLRGESSNNVIPLIPADKTVVFTCNDDMEITRPNTIVIDKPLEKILSQTVAAQSKETGRKNPTGSSSEKTVVFSLGDENHMDMTECHTVVKEKNYLRGESSDNVIPLIPADKTVVFTCNDDMEITRLNTVVTDNPTQKVAPQTVPEQGKGDRGKHVIGSSTEKAVVFSWGGENDMEITESHTAAISHEILSQDERAPHAQSAFHGDEMVLAFNQDDMEITESHNTDTTMKKGMHVDRLKLDMGVGQEAFSNSKTVVFAVGDDMETTKIHKVFLDYEVAQQSIQTIHAGPVFPANKTIVFTYDQEKMDITASHTVAINSNNLKGSEDQEVSSKSHKQQNLCRTSAPTCGERTHFLHTEDLGKGCHSDVGDNHGPDFPALSVLMFPGKKEEREILKIHSDATEKSIVPISLSIPEVTSDSVQEPQNVNNFSKGSSSSVYCRDLKNQVKPKSKRVSFKLPENQIESSTYNVESQRKDVAENSLLGGEGENGNNVSQVLDWNLKSHLSKETINSLNTGAVNMLDTGNIDLKNNPGTLTSYRHEHGPAELDTDGTDVISHKETKENEGVSAEWEELKRDTEKTKQFSQDSDMPAEKVDPKLLPELSEIVNICSKIKNLKRKYDVFPVSQMAATSNLSENFPKLPTQPEELLSLGKDVEKGSTNALYNKEEENVYFENGDGPTDPLSDTTHTGKLQVRNLPLGIFPPKLPNKRNSTASSVKDLNAKSVDGVEIQGSEINIVTSNTSDNVCSTGRQNLSPSQYIDEELLPTCPEELDSVEFVSYEPLDGAYNEMNKKAIFQNKSNQLEEQETCKNQKRAWEQEKEELHKEKKMKRIESWDGDTTKEQQATASIILSHSQAETHEGENPSSVSAKSLERTNSSNSSCLDSLKTDTDFSMQQSSQKERQLLMDSICEENLFEKLQDGVITVGEFLTLLQVHVLIQKPRQSHLPANHAVDTAPTPEDLIFSEYIYRPKLQIYEEDCQVLAQMIEDLKLCAGVQDKLLVDVNKSLWEVMRTCSDNELKNFGTELNKMKSCFTKKSKVLGHKGKVKLYDNLVQNTQIQWEKLQSRIAKVDEFLREMDSCLCALGTVTELEEWEADVSDPVADWESKVRNLEKELENLRAQEEELQRDLINLEIQKQQGFSEINCLQKKASDCEELLDRYNFTEWEMSEWSDQQAVFIFLYGSVELTIKFEPPMDGAVFNDNPCRKIIDISFESLLDEEKAPFSSCLVQRLIFQFIESQGFWQTKCTTMHHLPQMLHEISLVVNRCRLLGEEIEFLNRWGGKFNLLKTEVDNTKVKLSFSTSTAFAKFEVTLSLSANYPSAPLPFTVKKQIGRLGHDEISAVLSNVPLGTNYLRRMVKMIHQNLLQGSLIIH
ncbi:outer kinetochore KNL1 complex subunit KNL1 [Carettochelys insculpta]|uniref:outer kinetochore KNL1 complex subunit KNL1 n=1 Tax=Carettochelys insculpta TaxID=44489 RepID=UPI003EB8B12A